MLTIVSADSLISAWAWWSHDDSDLPKPPGNHWHFMQQTGYRKSLPLPVCDPESMLLVDRAMAQLKRSYDWEYRCIRAILPGEAPALQEEAGAGIDGVL